MIRDQDHQFGAAILLACETLGPLTVTRVQKGSLTYYRLENRAGQALVHLKRATKKTSPWKFTFPPGQVRSLRRAASKDSSLRIGLICHTDGVCCVPWADLRDLLPPRAESASSVSVSRPSGGAYRLRGPGGTKLNRAIRMSDWPKAILDTRAES